MQCFHLFQSNSFSVSMVNGRIVMVVVIEGQRKVIESKVETYNDGRWHYLTITKDGSK
jgi:laminin alpha 3/5